MQLRCAPLASQMPFNALIFVTITLWAITSSTFCMHEMWGFNSMVACHKLYGMSMCARVYVWYGVDMVIIIRVEGIELNGEQYEVERKFDNKGSTFNSTYWGWLTRGTSVERSSHSSLQWSFYSIDEEDEMCWYLGDTQNVAFKQDWESERKWSKWQ